MPWNGSGQFNRDTGVFQGATVWDDSRLAGRTVRADDHDTHDEDIATGLENTVTRDGQNSPSANLPMATFRHTGVGNAAARTDYAAAGQIQDQGLTHIAPASVAGTGDAITLSPTPAITAYAAGQRWSFLAEATNTGAVTVNVSALGTKAVQKLGAALVAGDITTGDLVEIEYDGTQFQMLTPARTAELKAAVDSNGNEVVILGETASAVNEITITNAATGNAPIIQSSGETNIGFQLQDSNGNEIILGASTASAVNEITATNAATANAPALSATGGDTNIDLNLVTKGTGQIDIGTGGATQAEMEAATAADKIVTPDSAQWHPGVAKAWVNFNGTGTVAIRTSHNVTSITDNGVGLYTVNFTTAFSSVDYTLGGTANFTGGGGAESVRIVSLTTTSAQVRILNADVTTDLSIITINFFGDQ